MQYELRCNYVKIFVTMKGVSKTIIYILFGKEKCYFVMLYVQLVGISFGNTSVNVILLSERCTTYQNRVIV